MATKSVSSSSTTTSLSKRRSSTSRTRKTATRAESQPVAVATRVAKSATKKRTGGVSRAVAKKTASSKRRVVTKRTSTPEVVVVEELLVGANESVSIPEGASKEYIVVRRCANCEHVPFSISRLVTLFSVLIVLLSVSVLIQVGSLDVRAWMAYFAPVAQAASSVFSH